MSKEATIIILDVWSSLPAVNGTNGKGAASDGDDASDFFTNARKCVNCILQRKIFAVPNDEVGLLLMGTDATDNPMNAAHGGYEHICEAFDVQCTTWHMLEVITSQVERGRHPGDWLDAILVALDMFNRHSARNIKSFKIVLVTAFQSMVDEAIWATVAQQLQTLDIKLVVITNKLLYNEDGEPEFRQTTEQSADVLRSQDLILQLIEETDGVICDFDQALVQLINFEKKKQRTMAWNSTLEYGTKMKMHISAYIQVKEAPPMPWRNDAKLKTKYYLRGREMPDDAVINNLVKCYKYGDRVVKYDPTLVENSVDTRKSVRIVGFIEPRHVLDQHCLGTGTWTVVGNPKYPASEQMFVSLVQSCKQFKRAILARYVYRIGSRPKMVALFPDFVGLYEDEPYRSEASLLMVQLVFKDNMTAMFMPPLAGSRFKPTAEQSRAVEQLVDAMDLMTAIDDPDDDDDKPPTEAFAFANLLNPTQQHMYRVMTHRALHPDQPLPPMDADLVAQLNVPPKLQAAAAEPLQRIRQLFSLKLVQKPTSDEKYAQLSQTIASSVRAQQHKRPLMSPESAAPGTTVTAAAAAAGRQLTAIGTLTPAEDFIEMLHSGERFSVAVEQLCAVLDQLVLRPMSVPLDRVGRALMVFREEAKVLGPHRYNEFIVKFKCMLIEREKVDVWQQVVMKECLGLITVLESSQSAIDVVEASKFYDVPAASLRTATAGVNSGSVSAAKSDVGDLMDMM